MKINRLLGFAILILFGLFIVACSDDDDTMDPMEDPMEDPMDPDYEAAENELVIYPGDNAADSAQLAFIEVDRAHIITFLEGEFDFVNTLSMDGKNNIIIRGQGRDKTILDFSQQSSGGEGVLITDCDSIRFENLTIRDAVGDALKTRDCNKVSFVNVGTIWSGEPSEANGAYGLYPVLCTEVYIDNCYAYGASDAGIYVGQSDQVIVKNSIAEGNVAGIEIENTTNADVFDNEAFDNTGGILVFDLPGLTKSGANTRVFNNNIHDNNRPNFAPAGNIVSNVPTGTGVMILSTKNVEIFSNTIKENTFTGVLVANYLIINDMPSDPEYNPFPSGISVHSNIQTKEGGPSFEGQTELIQQILGLIALSGLTQPDILIDGILMDPAELCIQEDESSFINLNASDPTFMSVTTDREPHNCMKDPLPEITFDPF